MSVKRRAFVGNGLRAYAGAAITGWASALRAAPNQVTAGTGDLTIIDAHTHFYDPTQAALPPGAAERFPRLASFSGASASATVSLRARWRMRPS